MMPGGSRAPVQLRTTSFDFGQKKFARQAELCA